MELLHFQYVVAGMPHTIATTFSYYPMYSCTTGVKQCLCVCLSVSVCLSEKSIEKCFKPKLAKEFTAVILSETSYSL